MSGLGKIGDRRASSSQQPFQGAGYYATSNVLLTSPLRLNWIPVKLLAFAGHGYQ